MMRRSFFIKSTLTLAISAIVLCGCATASDMSPVNILRSTAAPVMSAAPPDRGLSGEVVALAFSGGGARSAAFSWGVLLEMRDQRRADGQRWIDQVAFVTGVSGGAFTAAWFGVHGADGLDGFRGALLDKDWQGQVHDHLAWPGNWRPLARGGINGRDRIADWLDREVYGHARMSDLAGPPILLNAVELYTGMPFVFAEPWFDALCSDLRAVRVADAVAASAAYPFAVRPVVLGAYGQGCDRSLPAWVGAAARDPETPQVEHDTARSFQTFRDPAQIRFLHLLDGGVIDNFGLSGIAVLQRAGGLPYGPLLAPGDVVRMTRLRVIVVNGEKSSRRSWGQTRAGPNGMQVMAAIADHSTDAAKRNAYDAFVERLAHWEQDSIAWRCSLTLEEARRMGAPDGWNCADLHYTAEIVGFTDLPVEQAHALLDVPTRLSLPANQIDLAVSAGRAVIAQRLP